MASLPDIFKKTGEALSTVQYRPFDRFLMGPFMIWYGLQSKKMGKWPRRVLVAGGIYQLIYGVKEYQKLMGALKEGPEETIAVITNQSTEPPKELDL